jgi:endoglucanase
MLKKNIAAMALGLLLAASWAYAAQAKELTNFEVNQLLSPGINYGNVLEADPPEGWGLKVEESDFKVIAAAGFKSVRIPVRWSAKAGDKAPYTIEPAFFALADRAVRAGLNSGLYVIVNMHHYQGMFDNPQQHQERFLALWKQIAEHYRQYPSKLLLEILNEPNGKLTTPLWNGIYKDALKVIRASNPSRLVMVDAAEWGGANGLAGLTTPRGDDRLIFSFHSYTPMHFTHQGASWVNGSKDWLGTKWSGSNAEKEEVNQDFRKARDFQRKFNVPIFLGEFGAYKEGDAKSRQLWNENMVQAALKYGFSRSYWNFRDEGFGIYDAKAGAWNEPIKAALFQTK